MPDNMLQDRQDLPIWNAIEASNFKQALKLVDKRLSKKRTDHLEALKIYIQSRSAVLNDKAAILLQLEDFVERKSVLPEVADIDLYDEALESLLPNSHQAWADIIGELRWLCVKASPKNEELSLKCFQACLSRDDLAHAQQIANSLEKSFPNNHAYPFWNITTSFLYSITTRYPEKHRLLWGRLALGQIGKLAVATSQAADMRQLPVRSIQTPQELLLLHRITDTLGTTDQRMEYFKDPLLGPESSTAKGEWQLWRYKLQILEATSQWQELYDICSALLKRARTQDATGHMAESRMSDWLVWQTYIRAAIALNDHKCISKVWVEVEAHLHAGPVVDKTWRRNAALAWVKFTFEAKTLFSSLAIASPPKDSQLNSRVAAVVMYLQNFGAATTAYNDLRPFAERLNIDERTELSALLMGNKMFRSIGSYTINDGSERDGAHPLGELNSTTNVTRGVNQYKLLYLLTISMLEYEHQKTPKILAEAQVTCSWCSHPRASRCELCLERIARGTLACYLSSLQSDDEIKQSLLSTDRHPADGFCVLAAMCLIKIAASGDEDDVSDKLQSIRVSRLLQATLLLEYAYTHSKANFDISFILTRLYLHLGCASLAFRAYKRLGVKQVQLDTLAYIMFDRISSLHPHPFIQFQESQAQSQSPLEHLQKQQKLYRSSPGQINQNIWKAFEHGSYNAILEIREVSDTLTHTMAAAMSVVESRKISRLTQSDVPLTAEAGGYDILPPQPELLEIFSNTNDYDSFPNFECSMMPRFQELTQFAPIISNYRCRTQLLIEALIRVIHSESESDPTRILTVSWLKQHFRPVYESLQTQNQSSRCGSVDAKMTRPEQLAANAFVHMADIIVAICDDDRRSIPDLQKSLDMSNDDLCDRLEQQLQHVESLRGSAPALAMTLHPLYTAHELGIAIIKFSKYLSRQKNHWEPQVKANEKLVETAQRLLSTVEDKCTSIKKSMDEGGWIDKVLESVLLDSEDSSHAPAGLSELLRLIVAEDFREEWAGQVVESWRDSVTGFGFLKTS